MSEYEVVFQCKNGKDRAFRVRANSKLEAIDKAQARFPFLLEESCSAQERRGFRASDIDDVFEIPWVEVTARLRRPMRLSRLERAVTR